MSLSKIWNVGFGKLPTIQRNMSISKVIVRNGSDGPRMMRFKSQGMAGTFTVKTMLKYWLAGAVPAWLIIAYSNVRVGNAVLYDYDADILEPEHWEYYKHPIERWIARYLMEDPKLAYYKHIHTVEKAQRWERQIRLVNQVHQLQKLEREGAIQLYKQPALGRQLRDDADAYADQHGMQPRQDLSPRPIQEFDRD